MAKLYAGGQIRTLRTARGLTQADMARALDLSTSYLNQLENDQRPLTASVLVQLTTQWQIILMDQHFHAFLFAKCNTMTPPNAISEMSLSAAYSSMLVPLVASEELILTRHPIIKGWILDFTFISQCMRCPNCDSYDHRRA